MTTANEAANKGKEIANSFRGYSPIEVLEILTVITLTAVAAISQDRTYDDILDNGM